MTATASEECDATLLRAWARTRCEASFRKLVKRYLGLVESVARRRTGDPVLAKDVAQSVFVRLAAKASRIDANPTLAPWLHHCAWCAATDAMRAESTRRRHMNDYAESMRSHQAAAGDVLRDLGEQLDAAIERLPREDRNILFQRYFAGLGLREIAALSGKTEAAVRKRAQRALDSLASHLRTLDSRVSAPVLAAGLGVALAKPASAAAVTSVASAAITAAPPLAASFIITAQTQLAYLTTMTTTAKIAIAATCIAAAAISIPLLNKPGTKIDTSSRSAPHSQSAAATDADTGNTRLGKSGHGTRPAKPATLTSGELNDKIARIMAIKDRAGQTRALEVLLRGLKSDAEMAAAADSMVAARVFSRGNLRESFDGFISDWISNSPEAAMKWVNASAAGQQWVLHGGDVNVDETLGAAIKRIKDSAQAVSAAAQVNGKHWEGPWTELERACSSISARYLREYGPDEAYLLAQTLPVSIARDYLIRDLVREKRYASAAPDALKWVEILPLTESHNTTQTVFNKACDEILGTYDPKTIWDWYQAQAAERKAVITAAAKDGPFHTVEYQGEVVGVNWLTAHEFAILPDAQKQAFFDAHKHEATQWRLAQEQREKEVRDQRDREQGIPVD